MQIVRTGHLTTTIRVAAVLMLMLLLYAAAFAMSVRVVQGTFGYPTRVLCIYGHGELVKNRRIKLVFYPLIAMLEWADVVIYEDDGTPYGEYGMPLIEYLSKKLQRTAG